MSDDRRFIVTGAASGIGRAIAERFEALGGRVAGLDVDSERLSQVSVSHGLTCDVRSELSVQEAVGRAADAHDLGDIGVMALVTDPWEIPWQPRHQILSRLARYFHVVWCSPAPWWRTWLSDTVTIA